MFRLSDTLFHSSSGWHLTGLLAGVVFCLTVITRIFIAPLLEVGKNRFMMESRQGNAPLSTLFSVFQDDYWHVFCVQFVVSLQIVLWSLLLIVPGIMAAYSYAMTEFLLAEDPDLTPSEALAQSKAMMYGNRWRLFCLQISFIGWSILANITVIGGIFLTPYVETASAAFYRELTARRTKAQRPITFCVRTVPR